METIIADLVNRFEVGGLTRRQLIQGLSMLMAVSQAASTSMDKGSIKGSAINGSCPSPLVLGCLCCDRYRTWCRARSSSPRQQYGLGGR